MKSRRKAALDYIDAHLGNAQLGPNEIADATNVSRASLYRLPAAEGGIRAVLLKRGSTRLCGSCSQTTRTSSR